MRRMPGCCTIHRNPKLTEFIQVEYSNNAYIKALYKIYVKQ